MRGEDVGKMPIRFLMAISHNQASLDTFLKMDDSEQARIIKEATEIKSQRQMQSFVDNLSLK